MSVVGSSLQRLVLVTSLLVLLGACAANAPLGNPQQPYAPEHPPAVGDILHLPTGYYVSFTQLLTGIADARIIYVGETHDNPADHRLQLDVLTELAQRFPGKLALGMEMFTPNQQQSLDQWVADELSEQDFLRQVGWYRQWQMDFDYYRSLLIAAREHGIRVIGLNADKALVKTIGRTPIDQLSEEQQSSLPELDFSDPYQRAITRAIFGGHDAGGPILEGFLRVQTLWDETMAQNIVDYLNRPEHHDHKMIVIAGGNHIRSGYGIPRRVFRRLPVAYTLIGTKALNLSPEQRRDKLMDVTTPDLPLLPYTYLAFTAYETLIPTGVRLGVILKEEDGRVVAAQVLPDTPAERAGLRDGDHILKLGTTIINDKIDLLYTLRNLQPGDTAAIEVIRDGNSQELSVSFPVPNNP